MGRDTRTIAIPDTYVNALDSSIRISNFPDSACGVTCIQVVTLNRPDKLNAITPGMINSLIAVFSTVDVDDRIKVVILTGAGRAFSARIDLNELSIEIFRAEQIFRSKMATPRAIQALENSSNDA
ncbi:hypothetical protein ACHAPE_009516 [Trichoderma viride]